METILNIPNLFVALLASLVFQWVLVFVGVLIIAFIVFWFVYKKNTVGVDSALSFWALISAIIISGFLWIKGWFEIERWLKRRK